jgi:hypothetical protein
MTESKQFEASLVVLERNELLRVLAMVLTFGGPLLLATLVLRDPIGGIGFHAMVLGLWLWRSISRSNIRAKQTRSRVVVTPEGIVVDGKLRVRRDAVAEGYFQPRREGRYRSSVRVLDKHRRILFETEVEDEDQALALLGALGLDPRSHRAEFSAASPVYATYARQMLFVFGAIAGSVALAGAFTALTGLAGGPFLAYLFMPVILVGLIPAKIVVGADGVLVRWLWQKRFIPMSELRLITREENRGIRFHLQSGEEIVVQTSARARTEGQVTIEHREAVFARVNEALATFRNRDGAASASALVGRGTRSKIEWLEALKKLAGVGTRGGGYRDAALRDDDLWRLVEDPSAAPDVRAGAAFVLRGSLDDAGRARVRVAAEATASPKLRFALDEVAKDDAAELESALDDLEHEERAAS